MLNQRSFDFCIAIELELQKVVPAFIIIINTHDLFIIGGVNRSGYGGCLDSEHAPANRPVLQ